jgi:hypothetical protein
MAARDIDQPGTGQLSAHGPIVGQCISKARKTCWSWRNASNLLNGSKTTCQGPESTSREEVKKEEGEKRNPHVSKLQQRLHLHRRPAPFGRLRRDRSSVTFSDSGTARPAASLSLFCLLQTHPSSLLLLPLSYSVQQSIIFVNGENKVNYIESITTLFDVPTCVPLATSRQATDRPPLDALAVH